MKVLTKQALSFIIIKEFCAGIAQLAEQLICNQQVVGSIPIASSNEKPPGNFVSGLFYFLGGAILAVLVAMWLQSCGEMAIIIQ